MNLVTLEQAKQHLYVYHDADDALIEVYIAAATSAINKYLEGAEFGEDLPAELKQAALLLIGEFYKNREAHQDGEIERDFGYGYLPRPVVALLYPYRQTPI